MTFRNLLIGGGAACALLAASAAGAQTAPEAPSASAAVALAAEAAAPPPAKPVKPTVASLTAELAQARAVIEELNTRSQRQALALENARAELKAQRDAGALKDELLILGRERNAALKRIADEILNKYADVGLTESLKRREPFVQARRVALENEVQAYEDRLRAARILETTLPPSVERRMQEELARGQDPGAPSGASEPAPTPQ